jgi:hypothetical protein
MFIKNFISVLIFTTSIYAQQQSAKSLIAFVECDIQDQHQTIEGIVLRTAKKLVDLNSETTKLEVYYKNNSFEVLKAKNKQDQFGVSAFLAKSDFSNGRAYFKSSKAGTIMIDYRCYYDEGIPWPRCQSQGSGDHGDLSKVKLNINGTKIHAGLCHRGVYQQ